MKNTKNMFISIASVVILFALHTSTIVAAVTPNPGFEVFNKSAKPILITISLDNILMERAPRIDAGKTYSCAIALDQTVQLGIYTGEVKELHKDRSGNIINKPDYSYELNAPRKTKYVSWNPDDKSHAANPLYPQTGPWMGLLRRTETGFPLGKNNITQEQIIKK